MNIEEIIRKIVAEEIDNRQLRADLVPIAEFCKSKKISRVTLWRAEREGRLKLARFGKRVFINPNEFAIH